MSNHRLRRQKFFSENPFCCFCGGVEKAIEIDHIPARSLFINRQWPVGYEFPSCAACNDDSVSDELVMGFLVRIKISEMTAEEELEFDKAGRHVYDRFPNVIDGMREMSRIEVRKFLRGHGLPFDFMGPEPVAVEAPKELLDVPRRYGEKIGKALYYFHTKKIFPSSGIVVVKAMTNSQFMSPQFPIENFKVLNQGALISRSGKSLEDQFSYRYAFATEGGAAAFLVQFRESTAMLIATYEDKDQYEERKRARGY